MGRKKLTVYDYLKSKGNRQLSVMFVHNAEEAAAAEEANIDMICTSHDVPEFGIFNTFDELKRIRAAAPSCFMQSGGPLSGASEYEALKLSHKYMNIGADCMYGGNWSYKWIRALRDENIPINSHVGLIPGKATWIGGFRAIGKTADEAMGVLTHTLELQEAGVIGVELELKILKKFRAALEFLSHLYYSKFLKKVFTIPFLTMIGVWIIVYYQVTSHNHYINGGTYKSISGSVSVNR